MLTKPKRVVSSATDTQVIQEQLPVNIHTQRPSTKLDIEYSASKTIIVRGCDASNAFHLQRLLPPNV